MKNLIFILFLPILSFSQTPGTGLLFDDVAYAQLPKPPNNVSFFDDLADIKSASLKNYVPTVKSQGGYGTCLGWSIAYYARTILEAKQNVIVNKAEIDDITFSPIYTYLHAKVKEDNYNCQKGAFIHLGAKSLVDFGVPLMKDYTAEFCDNEIPQAFESNAGKNKIKDFRALVHRNMNDAEKIENVKRALHNGNPVVGGFEVENALYIAKNLYVSDDNLTGSGHAMCVIGFDDEKYGGAFEIVNSWGTNWGNSGFIWMKYEDFLKLCVYAVELIPNPKPVDEHSTLAGELRLELRGGLPMELNKRETKFRKSVLGWQDVVKEEDTDNFTLGDYATNEAFPKETRYRIYAKIDRPAYVYVFGADSNQENGVLFPFEENISTYFDQKDTELILPGENYFFRLNKDVASDYTIVLFSLEKIDYNDVLNKLNTLKGEITDKLMVIFNEKLISKDDMNFSVDQMKFNAKFIKGEIAMMVLDIRRT